LSLRKSSTSVSEVSNGLSPPSLKGSDTSLLTGVLPLNTSSNGFSVVFGSTLLASNGSVVPCEVLLAGSGVLVPESLKGLLEAASVALLSPVD